MSEQEIRLECARLSMQGYKEFIPAVADKIYNYVTSSEESKEVQKKPREYFLSRLCSKILRLQK
jgi:hypothetical protein